MPRPDPQRNRKRIVRLSILAGVVLLIGGGLYALFQYQTGKQQLETDEIIQQAREAYDKKDYPGVIKLLENPKSPTSTIAAIRGDAELLKLYVEARRNVPKPGSEHIANIIPPLQQIVRLTPEDAEAREELLGLLLFMQRFSEVQRLAESLVEKFPEDAELWRSLGTAQANLGTRSKALDSLIKAGELEPLNVQTQVAIIQLTQNSGGDIGPFVDQAIALHNKHPEDPRAELIRALAFLARNEMDQAKAMMLSAASRTPPDDSLIPITVEWLDKVELFDESTAYLNRVAESGFNSFASREAVYRTFDTGDMAGVVERLKDADPASAHPDLLAVWAIASYAQGDKAKATSLIERLVGIADPLAQAWGEVLPVILVQDADPGRVIDKLNEVITRDADDPSYDEVRYHPYLHHMLAQNYLQVDEPEAAVRALRIATTFRPSWSAPHRDLARTLLKLDRPAEAYDHARAAWLRQPDTATSALRVQAQLAATNPSDSDAVDESIKLADQLLAQIPDHPDVLPGSIALLARAKRPDQAKQRLTDALGFDPPLSVSTLDTLADTNERYALGMGKAIADTLREHHGVTPQLIRDQANALADKGQADQGRALIEQAMPDPPGLGWRLLLAKYLARTGDPQAATYWIRLADDHPDKLEIQAEAMRTNGVRENAPFAARAIQRLRKLGGESSIHWRLEQARVYMQGTPSPDNLNKALTLLTAAEQTAPDRLETQLELARCRVLLGDINAAEKNARNAKALAPNRPGVMLLLGQVLHQLNRFNESRVELTAVAESNRVSPRLRTSACVLLFAQGEKQVVREVIESMRASGDADNSALLLLAQIYAEAEERELADALCKQLLKSPDLETVAFVSSYYLSTGRPELAKAAREQSGDALSQADRLTLDSRIAAQQGRMQEALQKIQQAAEAEPKDANRWRNAAQMALSLSQIDQSLALAKRGLKESGEDAGLRSFVKHETLIQNIKNDNALIPIGITMLTSNSLRSASIETLRITGAGDEPEQTAQKLLDLAQSSPDYQSLQELTCDRLIDAKLNQRAFEHATKTATRFPNSGRASRALSLAAYRLSDWVTLLDAAEAWGQRSPSDKPFADLLLASAEDALQRYGSVVQTLAPHITQLEGGPDANPQHYILYTRALVKTDQPEKAWSILKPLIQSSSGARLVAMQRIGNDLTQPETVAAWSQDVTKVIGNEPTEHFELSKALYQAGTRLKHAPFKQQARQVIDRLLAKPGPHPPDAYFLQGQIARGLGDQAAAETSFRRVLKLAPDSAQVMNNLAMVLIDQNKSLNEAEKLAERATKLAEDDANLLDTLALVRLRLNKLDPAEQAITEAIRLEPDKPAWRLTHADILEAKGEVERANAIRERYSESPDN